MGEFGGNVHFVSLGCAKNLVDSEVMMGVLNQRGYDSVEEPDRADLIVVNTCGFLQSAVKEGIDTILSLSAYRREGRCKRLVVVGCMVERYRGDLAEAMPEVDVFLTTDDLLKIADATESSQSVFDQARRPYFLYDEATPRKRAPGEHFAYVKVAEGCDRPCTFCIIPKIRGAFRSRHADSIVSEAQSLLTQGVRELNLVAQDLTNYGADWTRGSIGSANLVKLLTQLEAIKLQIPDPFWIRLLYAYPIGVDEQLMNFIRDSERIVNYLDLPLQHISESVLKRMQRPLGAKRTRSLVEMMKKVNPDLALRTTFIVGFPGETESDIAELEMFIAEGHFHHVGVFAYSNEEESKAFNLEGQISEDEKQDRLERLMLAQQGVVEGRNSELLGNSERVLIERVSEQPEALLEGRAAWQAPEVDSNCLISRIKGPNDVMIPDSDLSSFLGQFLTVRHMSTSGYDLVSEIVVDTA
jgi:ribosomal protein S12 methylthiotransferase